MEANLNIYFTIRPVAQISALFHMFYDYHLHSMLINDFTLIFPVLLLVFYEKIKIFYSGFFIFSMYFSFPLLVTVEVYKVNKKLSGVFKKATNFLSLPLFERHCIKIVVHGIHKFKKFQTFCQPRLK